MNTRLARDRNGCTDRSTPGRSLFFLRGLSRAQGEARLERGQVAALGVDGEECGAIAKQWSGFTTEYFTDGDDSAVDFGGRAWSFAERAVIVGAALAIDLDHFERKGRGNESLFDLLR